MRALAVLVPHDGTPAFNHIAMGSAIVADLTPGQAKWRTIIEPSEVLVEVYFEGNLYGHIEGGFEGLVQHAADRLVARYPTVARGIYSRADFTIVGTYHACEEGEPPLVVPLVITDPVTLAGWSNLPEPPYVTKWRS